MKSIIQKIKKQETPGYRRVYLIGQKLRRLNFPAIKFIYIPLKFERKYRILMWQRFIHYFYYEPLFKVSCKKCGIGLKLRDGIPDISGNLELFVGRNVNIHGVASFAAGKTYNSSKLIIGDNVHLGYQINISIEEEVEIEDYVLIANGVNIMSYDFHPTNPDERKKRLPPRRNKHSKIYIKKNSWVGFNSTILKGVTIGEGAIVAANSVVTKDVEDYTIVAGNPASFVKKIETDI